MKVGYAVLYEDGTLTISKEHIILSHKNYMDFGEFEDNDCPWNNETNKIKTVQILDKVNPTTVTRWFQDCKKLTTLIDFQNLDVSDCKDFSYLFYSCHSLIDITTLVNWNVSNGKIFSHMFQGCESLTDISALINWDVSNGKDFISMFEDCELLQDISVLSNWNVANGEDFSFMFYSCESLQNINELQNWNVSNGKDFLFMFANCKNLKIIQLPQTLTNLKENMFRNCNKDLKIHWKNRIYTYEDLLEYETF